MGLVEREELRTASGFVVWATRLTGLATERTTGLR